MVYYTCPSCTWSSLTEKRFSLATAELPVSNIWIWLANLSWDTLAVFADSVLACSLWFPNQSWSPWVSPGAVDVFDRTLMPVQAHFLLCVCGQYLWVTVAVLSNSWMLWFIWILYLEAWCQSAKLLSRMTNYVSIYSIHNDNTSFFRSVYPGLIDPESMIQQSPPQTESPRDLPCREGQPKVPSAYLWILHGAWIGLLGFWRDLENPHAITDPSVWTYIKRRKGVQVLFVSIQNTLCCVQQDPDWHDPDRCQVMSAIHSLAVSIWISSSSQKKIISLDLQNYIP